jgi:MFS superfamily sulfate permease-like transporter
MPVIGSQSATHDEVSFSPCHRFTDLTTCIQARLFFFISILRIAFVMIFLTLASWLYAKPRKTTSGSFPIRILKDVPKGLKQVHAPTIDHDLLKALAPRLPVATVVLLLEHIAIAKCLCLDLKVLARLT